MYGRWEDEHMCPVLIAAPIVANSCVFIDSNSLSKDGRKIHVGECALFEPTNTSPPFVGLIRRLIVDKEDNLSVSVNRLYRPAEVKLLKGALPEAAPNEVFYSFHQGSEIPASSLLHPCKVAFLCKGVELPSRISSFVCRRVYDIETKRLWWLTDKDYINERQEEVNQLLDKTRLEMYGGQSPKPLNGPDGTTQLKSSTDNLQKSKKREHNVHSSDSVKRERLSKADDADSAHLKPENMLKTEIAKITDKGGLVDYEGVEKLIKLMKPEDGNKKLDLVSRVMLVDVITVTDRSDCLTRFVQLRGLHVINDWLQEVHKGKFFDGSPKGSDKSIEEFLFALLRALNRLPVNLLALQTCNIGKSVNHLRSHRSSEIQKKARSLVDTWKKRVEAEMNVVETRSRTRKGGSWPNKSMMTDAKISTSPPSTSTGQHVKSNSCEPTAKSPESPVSVKLSAPSTVKEEKSSSSSPSGEHRKAHNSCKDDDPSTSGTVNKNSSGVFHGMKSDTVQGSAIAVVKKEGDIGKINSVDQNSSIKITPEGAADASFADSINNQRVIVRLPNTGRILNSGGSFEDASTSPGKSSPLVHLEKQDHIDTRERGKGDALPMDLCRGKEELADSDDGKKGDFIPRDEKHGLDREAVEKLGKMCETSCSSINALVESCAEFCQVNAYVAVDDDVGMNLLASVATGAMSRSGSPEKKESEDTSRHITEGGCKSEDILKGTNDHIKMEQISSIGNLPAEDGSQQQILSAANRISVDCKAASFGCEKTGELDSTVGLLKNGIKAPEVKPASFLADASPLLSSIDSTDAGKEGEQSTEKNVVPLNAATSAKVETQINDESASRLSSEKQKEPIKDCGLPTTSCGYTGLGQEEAENDENKKMRTHAEQSEKTNMDHNSSVLLQLSDEHMQESLDKNKVSVKSPVVLVQEDTILRPVSEKAVKLDFDLNEVLASVDGIQGDVENLSAVHTSCSLPPARSLVTGNRPTSVTVAAAAKGPFFPSENLLRGKAELGWKGSAATSAFRPAEPRKLIDMSENRASKKARAFLDFDLNVDVVEDASQNGGSNGGGLDLNQNACEESPGVSPLSVSFGRQSIAQFPPRLLHPGRFSNSHQSPSAGFDLNTGPNMEEVAGESLLLSRDGMQFLSTVPSVRMNNMDMGNFSSRFSPTSAYPAPIVPGRGEQHSYAQTMMNPGTQFNPEMFRGPVLSASPAVTYSSTTPVQFPGFPFETNFSLPSNTDYVGSSGGKLCFPTVPPQLVGPSGVVTTSYRPYVMSFPADKSSNVGPDNRKWGNQCLDLNSGPEGSHLQLPQSVIDEQLKMFQQMTAAAGGLLKRKDPPVDGWDRSYTHHSSWQ